MPQMENAANLRRRYADMDLIVSCGDLPAPYLEYITSITNLPLYYVRGNHDESYKDFPPGGIDLHNKLVTYKGLSFFGIEGSIQYSRGDIQYTQFEMQKNLVTVLRKLWLRRKCYGYGVDVLVTHSPAWGIHDAQDQPHHGFKAFLKVLKWIRPRYMVHGHVHTWDRRVVTTTQYLDTEIHNINPLRVLEIDPLR
ncbi:metallophosphoesterase [Anaerolineales bacterium]